VYQKLSQCQKFWHSYCKKMVQFLGHSVKYIRTLQSRSSWSLMQSPVGTWRGRGKWRQEDNLGGQFNVITRTRRRRTWNIIYLNRCDVHAPTWRSFLVLSFLSRRELKRQSQNVEVKIMSVISAYWRRRARCPLQNPHTYTQDDDVIDERASPSLTML